MGSAQTWTNPGPKSNNAVGLVSFNTHPGNYYSQFWFNTAANQFYFRSTNNAVPSGGWQKVYHDGNLTDNSSDWDTAFGWGNHASEGYAPIASPTFTGDVTVGDLYPGNQTTGYMREVTGSFGSVEVTGADGSSGAWSGYSIGGEAVFMSNLTGSASSNRFGLYDDLSNAWVLQYNRDGDGAAHIYGSNVEVLDLDAGYCRVAGQVVATGNITTAGFLESSSATVAAPAAGTSVLTGKFLWLDGKEAIDGDDNWLRLNQDGDFTSGVFTPGNVLIGSSGNIQKFSHGNFLYHQSSSYAGNQSGGITFSTSAPTGGVDGDIWLEY